MLMTRMDDSFYVDGSMTILVGRGQSRLLRTHFGFISADDDPPVFSRDGGPPLLTRIVCV